MDKSFIYQLPERSGLYLDPRTKVLLILIVTILVLLVHDDVVLNSVIIAIPMVLLFLNGNRGVVFIYGSLFFIALVTKIFFDEMILPYSALMLLGLISELIFRLSPVLMLIYYMIESTRPGEFISAMSLWHLSNEIIVTMVVVFHFLPKLAKENKDIKSAMKMRGIRFGTAKFWKHPLIILEYRWIPLLISISKIREELLAAALSRGLGVAEKRSSLVEIGFGMDDAKIGMLVFILAFWTIVVRFV